MLNHYRILEKPYQEEREKTLWWAGRTDLSHPNVPGGRMTHGSDMILLETKEEKAARARERAMLDERERARDAAEAKAKLEEEEAVTGQQHWEDQLKEREERLQKLREKVGGKKEKQKQDL